MDAINAVKAAKIVMLFFRHQAKDDCPLVLVVLAFHFLRAFSFPVTIYTSTPRPESQYASA